MTLNPAKAHYLEKIVSQEFTTDLTYDQCVEAGKKIVRGMECFQAQLAYLACKVCTIRHGGISSGYYTVTDFAKDIGIPRKSLQRYTLIYRNVLERLGVDVKSITKKEWSAATRVSENMVWANRHANQEKKTPRARGDYKRNMPASEVKRLYEMELDNEPSIVTQARSWTQTLRMINGNIKKKDLSLVSDKTLEELMQFCDEVSDYVNHYLTTKKKKTRQLN